MQREFVLVKRNAFLYIFRFFLTMFMAVVTATLFLRTQLHPDSVGQGQLYFAVVFFSLIMLMFDGFAEMTFTILRLPGFFKQRGAHMQLSPGCCTTPVICAGLCPGGCYALRAT